jgi:nucleotide-binding universal stress UspA family protein
MKKILVTTDFSANARTALRFAIQLRAQHETPLTFLPVQHIMRLTAWSKSMYCTYEKQERVKVGQPSSDEPKKTSEFWFCTSHFCGRSRSQKK